MRVCVWVVTSAQKLSHVLSGPTDQHTHYRADHNTEAVFGFLQRPTGRYTKLDRQANKEMDRERDRQTDTKRDRGANEEMDRQRDRQTDMLLAG